MQPSPLPKPLIDRSATVFEALETRRTSRTIRARPVPVQILPDILWAAQSVNRLAGPFGAGSASNTQEIRIYGDRQDGMYLYEPDSHQLTPVVAGDCRSLAIGPG